MMNAIENIRNGNPKAINDLVAVVLPNASLTGIRKSLNTATSIKNDIARASCGREMFSVFRLIACCSAASHMVTNIIRTKYNTIF